MVKKSTAKKPKKATKAKSAKKTKKEQSQDNKVESPQMKIRRSGKMVEAESDSLYPVYYSLKVSDEISLVVDMVAINEIGILTVTEDSKNYTVLPDEAVDVVLALIPMAGKIESLESENFKLVTENKKLQDRCNELLMKQYDKPFAPVKETDPWRKDFEKFSMEENTKTIATDSATPAVLPEYIIPEDTTVAGSDDGEEVWDDENLCWKKKGT